MKNNPWEVKDIDLDLRHYAGSPTDVIKQLKTDIEKYLSKDEATYEQRQIYSAIYNALEFYSKISYIQPADYDTDDSFLSQAISTFNDDFRFLSGRHNSSDPTSHQVISFKSRIKSPISFVTKITEKINEYLEQGRDLQYFNESLRDIIGARIIIDPPQEVQEQGLAAESDFLYSVFYDFAIFRGVDEPDRVNIKYGNFRFLDVNTRFDPNKKEIIEERPGKHGFADYIESGEHPIYIPTYRIPEVEQPHVSRILKDYNMYPKYSGYQSLHVCFTPDYSDYMEHPSLPSCIIPQKNLDYFVEYQFRTAKQDQYAERGPASHKTSYKPEETASYHRLAVPLYIEVDGPHDLADNNYTSPIVKKQLPVHAHKKLKLRNFAECFERFYGYSFQDYFGISFKDFRDTFGTEERDAVLAGRKKVIHDKVTNTYHLENQVSTIPLSDQEKTQLEIQLSKSQTSEEVLTVLNEFGLLDGSKNGNPEGFFIGRKKVTVKPFKFIPVVAPTHKRDKTPVKQKSFLQFLHQDKKQTTDANPAQTQNEDEQQGKSEGASLDDD